MFLSYYLIVKVQCLYFPIDSMFLFPLIDDEVFWTQDDRETSPSKLWMLFGIPKVHHLTFFTKVFIWDLLYSHGSFLILGWILGLSFVDEKSIHIEIGSILADECIKLRVAKVFPSITNNFSWGAKTSINIIFQKDLHYFRVISW